MDFQLTLSNIFRESETVKSMDTHFPAHSAGRYFSISSSATVVIGWNCSMETIACLIVSYSIQIVKRNGHT